MSTEAVGLTWGDFQPIIHLSIALNAAYATLYSFVDDLIKQETDTASKLRDRLPLEEKGKARRILSNIYDYENELREANRRYLKPISILFSLIGVILLIVSAYAGAQSAISSFFAFFCCVLLLPFFLAMIVYGAFFVFLSLVAAENQKLLASAEARGALKS